MQLYLFTFAFFLLFLFVVHKNRGSLFNGFLFFLLMGLCGLSLSRLAYMTGFRVLLILEVVIVLAALILIFSAVFVLLFLSLISAFVLIRREGRSLTNLLSLFLGLGLIVWLVLQQVSFQNPTAQKIFSAGMMIVNITAVYLLVMFSNFLLSSFVCRIYLPLRKQDYIIVLGAGLLNGEEVSPLLAGRIDRAIKIYNRQKKKTAPPMLILSGGQGADEKLPEGQAMAQYALAQGIPEEHLLVEDKSRNTYENMLFSKQLIESRGDNGKRARVLFSTTNYHVFRSTIYARRVRLKAQGVGAKTKFYFWYNAILREFAALLAMNKKTHIVCVILLIVLAFALHLIPEVIRQLSYIDQTIGGLS